MLVAELFDFVYTEDLYIWDTVESATVINNKTGATIKNKFSNVSLF